MGSRQPGRVGSVKILQRSQATAPVLDLWRVEASRTEDYQLGMSPWAKQL